MTPKHEFEHEVKRDVETRVREGVKAVLEEVLQEEVAEHLEAGYRELTPTRRGERNGYYQRNLLTPAGKIERPEVPRDREGEFVTEVFERYKRMTGDVEDFDPKKSDLDFSMTFSPMSPERHAAAYFGMLEDLEGLFGRRVEIGAVRNPYLRRSIEEEQETVDTATNIP